MRLFSSRIKNVVPLSLLAILVCTSCSQDSELDQSLEELENGDYQTLADKNMTRSAEYGPAIIKAGTCINYVGGPSGNSVEITFSWTRGYPNHYTPLSTVSGSADFIFDPHLKFTRSECQWEGGGFNAYGRFYYVETDYAGRTIGCEKFFDCRSIGLNVEYDDI